MKIQAGLILLGAMLLFIAYWCLQISIPWLTFTPLPTLTTANPLEPLAFILAGFGIILIIFGLIQNTLVRFVACIIIFALLIAYFKGWLNLEQIWRSISAFSHREGFYKLLP